MFKFPILYFLKPQTFITKQLIFLNRLNLKAFKPSQWNNWIIKSAFLAAHTKKPLFKMRGGESEPQWSLIFMAIHSSFNIYLRDEKTTHMHQFYLIPCEGKVNPRYVCLVYLIMCTKKNSRGGTLEFLLCFYSVSLLLLWGIIFKRRVQEKKN